MNSHKQALVAIVSLLACAAHADGGDVSMPASYPIEEPQAVEQTCADAARNAAFLRELARTDGDVEPDSPAIPECNEEPKRT